MNLVSPKSERRIMGGAIRPWHIIVLAILLIVLFGAKRLPDAARSLGRSLRIFKAEAQTGGRVITPEVPDDEPSPLPRPEPVEQRRDER
jgi:sec-independent protein translocase protein TatA